MNISITGSGSFSPDLIQKNESFLDYQFLNSDGSAIQYENPVIIQKFKAITGIEERRYAPKNLNNSDLAYLAAASAIENAKIDPETLDQIIVAHNFGDIKHGSHQVDTVPSLATRVKQKLQIKNPKCVAYDVLFGCPGWIQGVIQAYAYINAGIAQKCLIIGSETLSRVVDHHDRDAMIYADGAGAIILEATENGGNILAHEAATFAEKEANYLCFDKSYNKDLEEDTKYLKMNGRKIYEFAVTQVPKAMKACLDKSGVPIESLKKVFLHQANEKMDEAIINRFYQQYNSTPPENIMPMNIHKLGNSSVATIPTLFDAVKRGKMKDQQLSKGDVIIFASVGAGMNINAFVYKY